jgi:hypothetical protein
MKHFDKNNTEIKDCDIVAYDSHEYTKFSPDGKSLYCVRFLGGNLYEERLADKGYYHEGWRTLYDGRYEYSDKGCCETMQGDITYYDFEIVPEETVLKFSDNYIGMMNSIFPDVVWDTLNKKLRDRRTSKISGKCLVEGNVAEIVSSEIYKEDNNDAGIEITLKIPFET